MGCDGCDKGGTGMTDENLIRRALGGKPAPDEPLIRQPMRAQSAARATGFASSDARRGASRRDVTPPGDFQWDAWNTLHWSGTSTIKQPLHRALDLSQVSALVLRTFLYRCGPSGSAKLFFKTFATPDSASAVVSTYTSANLGLNVQFISLEAQQSPNMRRYLGWEAEGIAADGITFRSAVSRTGTLDSGPIQSVLPRVTGPIVPIGRNLVEFQPVTTVHVGWNTGGHAASPSTFAASPSVQWLCTGGYRRLIVEAEVYELTANAKLWLMAGNDPGGYWATTEVTGTGLYKFSLSDAGTSSLLSILRWGISTASAGNESACFRLRARVE